MPESINQIMAGLPQPMTLAERAHDFYEHRGTPHDSADTARLAGIVRDLARQLDADPEAPTLADVVSKVLDLEERVGTLESQTRTEDGGCAIERLGHDVRQLQGYADALGAPDPDESGSETGAREIHERAQALAETIRLDRPYSFRESTATLADMLAQLAACVTCYIEDNERRLDTHEISNAGDVTRLVTVEQSLANVIRDHHTLADDVENLDVGTRLAALEDERADEVDTRSPEWQEAYDQGWAAALAARDTEDAHENHDAYFAGCEACDEERAGAADEYARGRHDGLRAAGNIMAAAIQDARKGNAR